MNVQPRKKPLAVAIMGPTASGKTAAALEVARHIPSEIISVDSALVYRDMNVGTAKPTAAERAQVPHHLIDIIDPTQAYSAAKFREDAMRITMEIIGRGKLPLLVGGTMLYFKALIGGLDELPSADTETRVKLDAEAARLGWPGMHRKLSERDPVTAARLKPNDAQRIQRALEIIELTGQPMSQLLAQRPTSQLPFELILIALEPSDRKVLHERIARRFDVMLEGDALLHEVENLRQRGDLHPGLPAMRSVGYRQSWEFLDGQIDKKQLREKSIAATRQLAKRQLTWLRAMPERLVVDCLDPQAPQIVLDLIQKALEARE